MQRADEMQDDQLVRASLAGDIKAFGRLVERHHGAVLAVAFACTRDLALGEDIAQEAFCVAWTDLPRLREPARVRSWLCQIARNRSRMALRGRRADADADLRQAAVASVAADGPSPRDEVSARQTQHALTLALQEMPAKYREPLILFYWEDRSIDAVASALAITAVAAQKRISRAREYLKDELLGRLDRVGRQRRTAATAAVAIIAVVASRPRLAAARASAGVVRLALGLSLATGAAAAVVVAVATKRHALPSEPVVSRPIAPAALRAPSAPSLPALATPPPESPASPDSADTARPEPRMLTSTKTAEASTAAPPRHAPALLPRLDRDIIKDGIAKVKSGVAACPTEYGGVVKVWMRVAPEGEVTESRVVSTPSQPLGACVAHVLDSATFAATQEGGSFSYPFVFDGPPAPPPPPGPPVAVAVASRAPGSRSPQEWDAIGDGKAAELASCRSREACIVAARALVEARKEAANDLEPDGSSQLPPRARADVEALDLLAARLDPGQERGGFELQAAIVLYNWKQPEASDRFQALIREYPDSGIARFAERMLQRPRR
jgi:RNA polymerase sigma factor (sigma-70 family)